MNKNILRNDDALAEYLKSISSELLKVAYSFTQDDAIVDDVISETIYRVYKHRKKVKQPQYFKTWIIRILINECKTELIKRRRILSSYDVELVEDVKTDDFSFVYEYIDRLQSPYREIVTLKTLNDYTFTMIANILDQNENTVKTKYYKALDLLREELKEVYE